MIKGTNLFDFAPRELSQSAFWAWVLQSVDPREQNLTEVSSVGEALLERLSLPIPKESIKVETEYELGDAGRADIYAEIDGQAALLIEHKVSSSLRPEQLRRYRESVDETVTCLFLSTGYELRKKRTGDGFKGIGEWNVFDAQRLLDLLRSTDSGHAVVVDYRQWLVNQVGVWRQLEDDALSEDEVLRKEALQTIPGQWRFMQHVTGSFSTNGRSYSRPARTSGDPWTQFLFTEKATEQDSLFYRIEELTDGPVFRLKQYQKDPYPSWQEKKTRRDRLRELWNQRVKESGCLDWVEPTNRGKNSSAIARINLLTCTASDLADELSMLHPRFVERVEEEFGWPIGRHRYRYECRDCGTEFLVEQTMSKYGQQIFPPSHCRSCEEDGVE